MATLSERIQANCNHERAEWKDDGRIVTKVCPTCHKVIETHYRKRFAFVAKDYTRA